jgi:hypothetical protein
MLWITDVKPSDPDRAIFDQVLLVITVADVANEYEHQTGKSWEDLSDDDSGRVIAYATSSVERYMEDADFSCLIPDWAYPD